MASAGGTLDSRSASNAETRPAASNTQGRIRDSIERLQSWIAVYVKTQLGYSVSPSDFTERVERRLLNRAQEEGRSVPMDDAVRNTVKLLVHEDRRSEFRRAQICTSLPDIEKVEDPESLEFATRIERESQVRFIRERIPADLRPVVDSLYGFVGEETVNVGDLAKRLGLRRNTLEQRLHRLYAKLRSELR